MSGSLDIAAVIDGLVSRLGATFTAAGWNLHGYGAVNPFPPALVVSPAQDFLDIRLSMRAGGNRGLTEARFTITALIAASDERQAMRDLFALSGFGTSSSLVDCLMGDRTWGGVVADSLPGTCRRWGFQTSEAGSQLLVAEFPVTAWIQ